MEKKIFAAVGDGDNKISLTAQPDIARFVGYTLTHLPRAELENKILGVEGSRRSIREIHKVLEGKLGTTLELKLRPSDEVAKDVEGKGPEKFVDYIMWMQGAGYGDVSAYDKTSVVPDWKPKSFEEAVNV